MAAGRGRQGGGLLLEGTRHNSTFSPPPHKNNMQENNTPPPLALLPQTVGKFSPRKHTVNYLGIWIGLVLFYTCRKRKGLVRAFPRCVW